MGPPLARRDFGRFCSRARTAAGADPLPGIFSHIGPVALNGVLDSAVRLRETVAVFGLGVVGQLCVQLLKLAGARVIGADLLDSRRALAAQLGLEHVLDPDVDRSRNKSKISPRGEARTCASKPPARRAR